MVNINNTQKHHSNLRVVHLMGWHATLTDAHIIDEDTYV